MDARRFPLMSIAAAGLSVLAATEAAAQSYPQRAIRLVIDRPAGVPHDILARAMADKLSAGLKQTIIVDNRVGVAATSRPNSSPAPLPTAPRCSSRSTRR